MGSVQKKTWACDSDDGTADGTDKQPLDERRWLDLWAFGTGASPAGLGLTSVQFWGLTPREFQALVKVWDRNRDFQIAVYADIHATLRNLAIEIGFKPPVGKVWTREMLTPGYKPSVEVGEYDWKTQKRLSLHLVEKPEPKPEERAAAIEAARSNDDRFRQAQEATRRGASAEEIRLIMEA